MSTDRWMDKEDVVHLYNGILSVHKKEWNNAICSNMDGPRDYYIKRSKSEKDKHHMTQLYSESKKKWHKWTYLQNRNRLIDIENKSMVTEGERGVEGINEALGLTGTHYNV